MALSGGFSTTTLSSGGRDGEPAEQSSAFSLSDIAGVANMVESVVTSSAFSIREALEPTSTVGTSGGCGETSSEQLPASSGAAQESPSTVVTIRGCGGASSDAACVEASIPGFDDQRLSNLLSRFLTSYAAEIRKQELIEKYNSLKKSGKLSSFLDNGGRRTQQRIIRYMPYRRSDASEQ
ncbi:hypothetical protein Bca4012_005355 [Brassica carinata]|uniref:Uncharacterized protein n=1 Tax=Brassica carinata TaxID=52824 RepID=A0A8X7RSR8_BRACI|nr:hypothetical protein Bca52824_040275 [Brassica carinata]